jgi:hypothetical protein
MDALLTDTIFSYDGPPPLRVGAPSEAALRRARDTAGLAGLRAVGQVGIGEALKRLREQAAASGIWVELDEAGGAELDALLDEAETISSARPFGVVVSVTSDLVDSVASRIFAGNSTWLVDAEPLERAASLATATALANAPARANDVSRDPGAERLRQLSDEVSRIATTLARLSAVAPAPEVELRKPVEGDVPDVSVETVRSVIRARRLRSRFFAEDLFADPAWDMLLDLLQAEIAQLRVPVSASASPPRSRRRRRFAGSRT